MKIASYISLKEKKAVLIVGFAAFIFSIAGLISYNVKEDLKRAEYYREQSENKAQGKPTFSGPYCFSDRHPQHLLKIVVVTGLTFSLLIFSKKSVFSAISTLGILGLFLSWYLDTQIELSFDEWGMFQGIDRIFFKAGNFDLSVFLLSLILLFWQISILLRMLIKNIQRKNVLP